MTLRVSACGSMDSAVQLAEAMLKQDEAQTETNQQRMRTAHAERMSALRAEEGHLRDAAVATLTGAWVSGSLAVAGGAMQVAGSVQSMRAANAHAKAAKTEGGLESNRQAAVERGDAREADKWKGQLAQTEKTDNAAIEKLRARSQLTTAGGTALSSLSGPAKAVFGDVPAQFTQADAAADRRSAEDAASREDDAKSRDQKLERDADRAVDLLRDYMSKVSDATNKIIDRM
jgi:hypothetical protein